MHDGQETNPNSAYTNAISHLWHPLCDRWTVTESKRILIVDDDVNIQRVVRVCLESAGYQIRQAADGATALELIGDYNPDLMLLDLSMPVLDGMSVLAELRSLPPPLPRVIVMTAHGSVRSAIQAVRLGAADFVEKPFTPAELRQSVASVLGDAADSPTGQPAASNLLHSVRDALRRGKFYTAEAALTKVAAISDTDPHYLNLVGVLHEAHGRPAAARNFYKKAVGMDPAHAAALLNLKRLDEIAQKGAAQADVALGDETLAPPGDDHDADSPKNRVQRMLDMKFGLQ